jgi:hypothetical protein
MDKTRTHPGTSSETSPNLDTVRQRPSGDRSRSDEKGSTAPSNTGEREYVTPTDILKDIGQTFKRNRRTSRISAWADLQSKVMGNPHILVPNVMTFDSWVKTGIAIEDFLKSEEGMKSEDPVAALRGYLNGDDTLLAKPKVQ